MRGYALSYESFYEGDRAARDNWFAETADELLGEVDEEFRSWVGYWLQDVLARDNWFDKNNYPTTLTVVTPLITEVWTLEKM
jgi:hypothetical protein